MCRAVPLAVVACLISVSVVLAEDYRLKPNNSGGVNIHRHSGNWQGRTTSTQPGRYQSYGQNGRYLGRSRTSSSRSSGDQGHYTHFRKRNSQ